MAVASPEQVCNLALHAIGYPEEIADIFEGSPHARIALAMYGQTRDELLRSQDWPFARGAGIPLTLLKGPPPAGGYNAFNQVWSNVYPPYPWLFEYAYPADCLELLALQEQPYMLPDLDPLPAEWRIDNDLTPNVLQPSSGAFGNFTFGQTPFGGRPSVTAVGPPAKVILANIPNATAVYRRQVTDLTLWQPDFVKVLVETLASKFSAQLAKSMPIEQVELRKTAIESVAAEQHKG